MVVVCDVVCAYVLMISSACFTSKLLQKYSLCTLKKYIFYLFDRERDHKQVERQAEGEGEAESQMRGLIPGP